VSRPDCGTGGRRLFVEIRHLSTSVPLAKRDRHKDSLLTLVGTVVGDCDGVRVGLSVGDRVGNRLGTSDGSWRRTDTNTQAQTSQGATVTIQESAEEEPCDRSRSRTLQNTPQALATCLDDETRTFVGVVVGAGVGRLVGVVVGAGVGASEGVWDGQKLGLPVGAILRNQKPKDQLGFQYNRCTITCNTNGQCRRASPPTASVRTTWAAVSARGWVAGSGERWASWRGFCANPVVNMMSVQRMQRQAGAVSTGGVPYLVGSPLGLVVGKTLGKLLGRPEGLTDGSWVGLMDGA
jgi:outer membrane lipoprotein SlyB